MVCLWDYVLFYIRFLIDISNKCLKCAGEYHFPLAGDPFKNSRENWLGWAAGRRHQVVCPRSGGCLMRQHQRGGEHTVFGQGCDDLYFRTF